jgi:hypothetical protein
MGPSRFTSHPKEGVLRIFIVLKNPSPRPGFNPLTGKMARTLNSTTEVICKIETNQKLYAAESLLRSLQSRSWSNFPNSETHVDCYFIRQPPEVRIPKQMNSPYPQTLCL